MGKGHILHIFCHIGHTEKGGSIAKWRGLFQNGLYHTGHISHILHISHKLHILHIMNIRPISYFRHFLRWKRFSCRLRTFRWQRDESRWSAWTTCSSPASSWRTSCAAISCCCATTPDSGWAPIRILRFCSPNWWQYIILVSWCSWHW